MCEYCGCQDLDVVAELISEHDHLRELGRELVAAAAVGDLDQARSTAQAMRRVLGPHTAVEETGLFPTLAADYAEPMAALTSEHRMIDETLTDIATAAPVDWRYRARGVVSELFEHILKEEDGVFPAALATLAPEQWEKARSVRARVAAGELVR